MFLQRYTVCGFRFVRRILKYFEDFRFIEFSPHTWRNVLLDVVVVPEIDVVEKSGAIVYVGVSIAPRDLSLWDCLKWRKHMTEEVSANTNTRNMSYMGHRGFSTSCVPYFCPIF